MKARTSVLGAMIVAVMVSLSGPVAAQSPPPGSVEDHRSSEDAASCMAAMHEMMAMMREHMGSGMMSGDPVMSPAPGSMGIADDGCLALIHEMMAMMRDHMGAHATEKLTTPGPSPVASDAHHPAATEPSAAADQEGAVRLSVSF
jgi:hypothetical protein